MRNLFKLVQGNDALDRIIRKMRGEHARVLWSGTYGTCEDIRVSMLYLYPKDANYCHPFYLLAMEHPKGESVTMYEAECACRFLVESQRRIADYLSAYTESARNTITKESLRIAKLIQYTPNDD